METATKELKLQPEESSSQNFVSTRNACKLCAPLGASVAFRGIEGCIPLIHGSQGCSTYIRRYVISHFKEPIDIASSNFNEESAIFGGGDNLKKALDNLTRQYAPGVIGIASTCLSETIGDDIRLYLDQYRKAKIGEEIPLLVHASTPSYRGTHLEGFHEAVRAVVEAIAQGGPREESLNILPGFLSPEDLRHLKEILADFPVGTTLLPDYSETLDGESWEEYQKLSAGGTPLPSIKAMGRAMATLQFGRCIAGQKRAATHLEETFGVPAVNLTIPIGIRASDRFFGAIREWTGREVPKKYAQERGRLVDAYIDGHKYLFGKRAVIYGEADFVVAMASFLDEIGIVPALCATGAAPGGFEREVLSMVENSRETPRVVEDTDFMTMLDSAREVGAEIVIGNSKGYLLARKLGIPMVRAGFPIHDRIGGQRILHVGYRGAQQLFDRIVNTLIEAGQEGSPIGYSYI
ncbi:MAG: nitrogenase component 1 [Syntrophales bacterium]|nr:nitrogenase component 1 [Syntrophales bacterium]